MFLKHLPEHHRPLLWGGVITLLMMAGALFWFLFRGQDTGLDCSTYFIRNMPKGEFSSLIHFHLKNNQGQVTFEGKYTPTEGNVTAIQRKVLMHYQHKGDRYFITSDHISVHADDTTPEKTLNEIFNVVYLKPGEAIELTFQPINGQGYLVFNGTIPAYFCENTARYPTS